MKKWLSAGLIVTLVIALFADVFGYGIASAGTAKPQNQVKKFMSAVAGLNVTKATAYWVAEQGYNVSSAMQNIPPKTKISLSKLKLLEASETAHAAVVNATYNLKLKVKDKPEVIRNGEQVFFNLNLISDKWIIASSDIWSKDIWKEEPWNVHVATPTPTATPVTIPTTVPPSPTAEVTTTSTIRSFTPSSGVNGTLVIITGTNLNGATAVSFGGTAASSYVVNSDTQITAAIGSGATGRVSVTATAGTATSTNNFTYVTAPTISSFTPSSGLSGTLVIITGTNLIGVTAVSFGGIAASSYVVNSDTQITAAVGNGATGQVSVTTIGGTTTSTNSFTYYVAPTIGSFTPSSGSSGTLMTITGTDLSGATAVSIGGTATPNYIVNSDTQITAEVGSGATGKVSVTTPGGTATSITDFTYVAATTTPVSAPTFSPVAGTYTSAQQVSIFCSTSGAAIRYTTDGSEPGYSSTVYSHPITVSSTMIIKAKAFESGMTDSPTGSAIYAILLN